MNEGTLYERATPTGTLVRIRRTSARGATPVVAVLEQLLVTGPEAGTDGSAEALSLLQVMVQTELDAVLLLEPHARTEAAVARLARTRQ